MATETKHTPEIQKASAAHALTPFDEMDRMFDSFFQRGLRPWQWPTFPEAALPFGGRAPKVDVIDREDEVVIRAEAPGVEKKDLDVSVGDDSVTIKGSSHHEEKEEKGDYYRHELSEGSFSRTVALPAHVDGAKAKASFKDGILELVLPKIGKAKRHSVKVD